jgi:hypothetical protein
LKKKEKKGAKREREEEEEGGGVQLSRRRFVDENGPLRCRSDNHLVLKAVVLCDFVNNHSMI